jgi:hypothetical protein
MERASKNTGWGGLSVHPEPDDDEFATRLVDRELVRFFEGIEIGEQFPHGWGVADAGRVARLSEHAEDDERLLGEVPEDEPDLPVVHRAVVAGDRRGVHGDSSLLVFVWDRLN